MNQAARYTYLVGYTFWAICWVLSLWFWPERTLFCDTAFQTFLMLTEGGLQIMVERWVAAGVRIFPWLAIQFQCPLECILMTYSMSYVIFQVVNFSWCRWWGQWQMAGLQIILMALFVRHTFFWISSELMLGLTFLISWWAWLQFSMENRQKEWLNVLILPFGAATIIYAHPLVIFPALFGGLFFLIANFQQQKTPLFSPTNWQGWGIAALLFFWVLKNWILPLNWYDAMSQARAAAIWETFPRGWLVPSLGDFLSWCLTDYPLFLPLLAGVLTFYVLKKEWLKLALTFSFTVGYLFIVHVPFAGGDRQFYLESFYHCLAIFVGLPLMYDVLPAIQHRGVTTGVLATVAALGIVLMIDVATVWQVRHRWQVEMLEKTAHRAHEIWVMPEHSVPMDTLQMSWGTSYEFLLLSALHPPHIARNVLVDENPERFVPLLQQDSLFLGEFKNYPWRQIPSRYFKRAPKNN